MSLPLDPALLDRLPPEVRALVEAEAKALEEERAQRGVVEHERAELKDLVARLKALVQALREARFAAKSEKLHPDQLQMAFEERDLVRHWFKKLPVGGRHRCAIGPSDDGDGSSPLATVE